MRTFARAIVTFVNAELMASGFCGNLLLMSLRNILLVHSIRLANR